MTNILKLVKLDFALIKPYIKIIFIALLSPLIVMYTMRDIISGTIFCMCIMAITSGYTFSVVEKNDLNRLYGLLPVGRKDIVSARYLFIALEGLILNFIGVSANAIILTILKVNFTFSDILIGFSVGHVVYYFFTAIQLPLFFKFGGIKGRFFSFLPFLGIFSISEVAKRMSTDKLAELSSIAIINNPYGILILSILFGILSYSISVGISQKIFSRLE
ncbi:ABC-2 transporter permease [Ruminiclostridium cellulolyticum]|uniref:ABC-2 transporter permease n=1 Tax=Ruminiclostridium cellulolyticum (strain ATCC 35319 / DSM 5812 / JCM 6584 / H10) TaxID=394503 RepID=B8I531_RUMCH|nr:ABC-2 transporter permease [Ruminiclostridium cellulolyticum]ACL74611.1 hypothetical protein Ccel_0224 [Ruminiclostridium cellulolyticum H10]